MNAPNVIGIHGQTVFKQDEAVPDVVEILEWALREAQSGNIRAIALAWVIKDATETPISQGNFKLEMGHGRYLDSAVMAVSRQIQRWLDS